MGWCTVRAATVTGVRHRLAGEPSQDSYAWAVGDSNVALAVTDGLGAVDGSERTAAAAAAAAVRRAVDSPAGEPNGADGVGVTRGAVDAANAASRGGGATTLVVAVAARDGATFVARVGDSTAFLVEPGGAGWSDLFEGGEIDEGALEVTTSALPADDPEVETARVRLSEGQVLVLVTDGIADPWRDGPSSVAPTFASLVSSHPSPLELAGIADFSRQGCHDDRTIALLWVGE